MAITNVFNKVKETSSAVIAVKNLKKSADDKKKEKTQMYSFVGMDVYELYLSGKLQVPELEVHFDKIKAIDEEIAAIENEVKRLEAQNTASNVCSCGCQLDAQNRFCPKCGKPVANEFITCTCGMQVKNDMKFCPACGNDMQAPSLNTVQPSMKECICGNKVPQDQGMCMECGRKI